MGRIEKMIARFFGQADFPDSAEGYYYINESPDFEDIKKIKCKVKKFGTGKNRYGVKRFDGGLNKTATAFRVPSYLFVFKKYRLFFLSAIALIFITLISKPIFTILAVVLTYAFVKLRRPFCCRKKLRRSYYMLYMMMLGVVLVGVGVIASNVTSLSSVNFANGLFYMAVDALAIFFAMGLVEKYDETYALNIDDYEEWNEADYFLWRGRTEENRS